MAVQQQKQRQRRKREQLEPEAEQLPGALAYDPDELARVLERAEQLLDD